MANGTGKENVSWSTMNTCPWTRPSRMRFAIFVREGEETYDKVGRQSQHSTPLSWPSHAGEPKRCSSLPPRGTQARPAPPVTFMLSSQRTVAARRYLDSSGHSKIGAAFIPLVQPLTVQSSALAGTAANTDRPSSSETNIFMILLLHTVVVSAHVGCGPKDQKAPSRIADWT